MSRSDGRPDSAASRRTRRTSLRPPGRCRTDRRACPGTERPRREKGGRASLAQRVVARRSRCRRRRGSACTWGRRGARRRGEAWRPDRPRWKRRWPAARRPAAVRPRACREVREVGIAAERFREGSGAFSELTASVRVEDEDTRIPARVGLGSGGSDRGCGGGDNHRSPSPPRPAQSCGSVEAMGRAACSVPPATRPRVRPSRRTRPHPRRSPRQRPVRSASARARPGASPGRPPCRPRPTAPTRSTQPGPAICGRGRMRACSALRWPRRSRTARGCRSGW